MGPDGRESSLMEWAVGAQAVALLRGALDAGVLAALRQPTRVSRLAQLTGRSVSWSSAMCDALEAHGVAVAVDGRYQLTDAYAAMLAPDALEPLADLLAGLAARVRHLETTDTFADGYTSLISSDRIAIARGLGASSLSSQGRARFAAVAAALAAVSDRWRDGADHLELGCGVGNALLSFAVEFPRLRAVGIEVDVAVAAEARRRAHLLGVADRVRIRAIDARALDDEARFDTAQWSQLFFPTDERDATLRALHRALKSGGLIVVPTLADKSISTPPASTLKRLLIASWGVPVPTQADLRNELEQAGFEILEVQSWPPRPLLLTDTVLLARRL